MFPSRLREWRWISSRIRQSRTIQRLSGAGVGLAALTALDSNLGRDSELSRNSPALPQPQVEKAVPGAWPPLYVVYLYPRVLAEVSEDPAKP